MNASEWRYSAEGGKHALFAYFPAGEPKRQWEGRLLRIEKKYLSLSPSVPSCCESRNSRLNQNFKKENRHVAFLQNVLSPLLASYIDVPEIVTLDWVFLRQLRQLTLTQGSVPSSRISDWILQDDHRDNSSEQVFQDPWALLVYDYRTLRLTPSVENVTLSKNCFSVEIKPKAGYRTSRHSLSHSVLAFERILQACTRTYVILRKPASGSKRLPKVNNP